MVEAVVPGGTLFDLQVIRPNPVVESDTRVLCEIDGESLLRKADAAARAVDSLLGAGRLVEEAVDDQVIGEETPDLVFVTGFVSNLAWAWEHPVVVRFYDRISSFSRLIRFDRRGTGLSDRPRDVPTLETRMDDLRVVMDAAGSERAAVLATFE